MLSQAYPLPHLMICIIGYKDISEGYVELILQADCRAGIKTWKQIQSLDCSPSGKVFFEIGTGRVPLAPLAYWLMGAEYTITIDLNQYLKEELIIENLRYIAENEEEILKLFGSLIDKDRLNSLLSFVKESNFSMTEFFDLCRIKYIAPGDAADTDLPDKSIDFHTSYTVFEHIPIEVLRKIIREGDRIIRENGLFVHRIDYSDHFSHSDKKISAIIIQLRFFLVRLMHS